MNLRTALGAFMILAGSVGFLHAEVTLTEGDDHTVRVEVDGKFFTEYRYEPDFFPILYPIVGPNGETVTLGDALLAPTRIYVKAVLELLRSHQIDGLAHITGGGLTDNLPRILPDGLSARIQRGSWEVPPLFGWMQRTGGVPARGLEEICHEFIGEFLHAAWSGERLPHLFGVVERPDHTERVGHVDRHMPTDRPIVDMFSAQHGHRCFGGGAALREHDRLTARPADQ